MTNVDVRKSQPNGALERAKTILDTLRENLIDERNSLCLPQAEIARRIGCSRAAIADFESGTVETSASIVFAYAMSLGLKISIEADMTFRFFSPFEKQDD